LTETSTALFVYGSLRRGEGSHHLLDGSEPIAAQAWTTGRLVDTASGYPAFGPSTHGRIYGELYRVPRHLLGRIDAWEDYTPGATDNMYERVPIRVETDAGVVEAETYRYLKSDGSEAEVPYGDWRLRDLRQRLPLYYFAFGSCMDGERFQLQGVGDRFQDRLGRGVLHGYDMRYTLPYPDGGRADLVEERGAVAEGVVYRIDAVALDYLFWREGVEDGIYRPAMVPIEMGDGLHEALTFLVIDKAEESAPPEHYAREILRGAYGTVSDEYHRKLKARLRERFQMTVSF
jgi:gamma-glutamylcyclotransferase (GGCT)/AIG2-like uncharacterized protein YtfP/cation transport regulator ChaC